MNTQSQRIFFLNGKFVPEEEAVIPVLDRGILFADAVYEVSAVVNGQTIDNIGHLERLNRSLAMLSIKAPYSTSEWIGLQNEIISRNALSEGMVYMHITRGVAAQRTFRFPDQSTPTVFMFTRAFPVLKSPAYESGISVLTVPDQRWARRNIKSSMLLAQVLATQAAYEADAQEAWLVEDGYVTEGASSSAFIVTEDGEIVTRPLSESILPGVTRQSMMALASETGLKIVERLFTVEETYRAREAFISAAGMIALSVVDVDGRAIGDGKPGPLSARLRSLYFESVLTRSDGE
jgi:D-alanine transaminase